MARCAAASRFPSHAIRDAFFESTEKGRRSARLLLRCLPSGLRSARARGLSPRGRVCLVTRVTCLSLATDWRLARSREMRLARFCFVRILSLFSTLIKPINAKRTNGIRKRQSNRTERAPHPTGAAGKSRRGSIVWYLNIDFVYRIVFTRRVALIVIAERKSQVVGLTSTLRTPHPHRTRQRSRAPLGSRPSSRPRLSLCPAARRLRSAVGRAWRD